MDMDVIRSIATDKSRQIIIKYCLNIFHELNMTVLAEGVETIDEKSRPQHAGAGIDFFKDSYSSYQVLNKPSII